MSKFIKITAIAAALFATSAFANDCGWSLFHGVTLDGKKEVSLCVYSKGIKNYVKYRFGKIGQKPELEFVKLASAVDYAYMHPYQSWAVSFDLDNGAYSYGLSHGTSDDGINYAGITVSKNGKSLAHVKLNPKSITGDKFEPSITDLGLMNYFENGDDRSQTKVLAPKLSN